MQVLAGALVACGGSTPAPTTTPAPSATPSASASATATTTATATVADGEPSDPTAGSGPCRCSWDTNAAKAPRVCKKGQTSISGAVCTPGDHKYKYPIKVGPLDPPDLA